jgi:hypothetical protein
MKVKFSDVGRNKNSWTAETKKVTFNWLLGQVNKNGGLISSDIDFTDSRTKPSTVPNGAFGNIVVGGFRPIGKYYIGKAIPKGEQYNVKQKR